jgi:hypothetical protein
MSHSPTAGKERDPEAEADLDLNLTRKPAGGKSSLLIWVICTSLFHTRICFSCNGEI